MNFSLVRVKTDNRYLSYRTLPLFQASITAVDLAGHMPVAPAAPPVKFDSFPRGILVVQCFVLGLKS